MRPFRDNSVSLDEKLDASIAVLARDLPDNQRAEAYVRFDRGELKEVSAREFMLISLCRQYKRNGLSGLYNHMSWARLAKPLPVDFMVRRPVRVWGLEI